MVRADLPLDRIVPQTPDRRVTHWMRFERRWRDALLEAIVPAHGDTVLGLAEVDTANFWPRFQERAPRLLRFGVRASVWLLTFMPLITIGRFRTFGRLSPADRDRCLAKWNGHRSYLVRQLVTTLKIVACFAYFRAPAVRQRINRQIRAGGDHA